MATAFSQPSNDGYDDNEPGHSILISMAAQLAHELGQKEHIKGQIPPHLHDAFELTYSVQAIKLEMEGHEQKKRQEQLAEQAYERLIANEDAKRRRLEDDAKGRGPLTDRILTFDDLKKLPQPAPLVRDVLYTGSVAVILGDSQTGKTWVMLSLAAAAASGTPWPPGASGPAPAPVSVLYIAAEDGGSIGKRLEAWERAHGRNLSQTTFHTHPTALDVLDPVQIEELASVITDRGYRLVIVDTVAASLGGEEEGNPQFSRMVQHMRILLSAMPEGGSVVLVHHLGKDKSKGARGGSSLFNDSDIVWELEGNMDAIKMKCKKWKTDSIRPVIHLRLSQSDPDAVHIAVGEPDGSGNASADDPRSKYAILANDIIKVVKDNSDLNQGYGPSGRQIRGALHEAGCQIRESTIIDQIATMEMDRRLIAHKGGKGSRGAVWYRLPPAQGGLSD